MGQRSARNAGGRRSERGQGLMEMALVLPLFLVIVIGLVEVADALNSYMTLVDASRDGARLGSKGLANDAQIENLVLTETGRLRDPVTGGDVTVTHTTIDGKEAIRVQVCYDRSLMLSAPLVLPDSFRMCGETTMRVLPTG